MKKFFLFSMMLVASIFMANAQKVGYLLTTESKETLPAENSVFDDVVVAENPEQNAAEWFYSTYVNRTNQKGQFVSLTDLGSLSPSSVSVLWINIDRVGLANLAAAGITSEYVTYIENYVKAGGHLLLTKQANVIAYNIGRINYAPGWGNGGYSKGGDIWAINPIIGEGMGDAKSDQSEHYIYNGIDKNADGNIELIGAVRRTDNNNNWEPMQRTDGTIQGNGDATKLANFQNDWNCTVLATWGHVQDFCVPGIIMFDSQGALTGKILTNGLSAYQWGTSNNYIDNVKKLTKNCIAYLYGSDPTKDDPATAIDNANDGAKATKILRNGQVLILRDGKTYNTLGVEVK